MDDSTKQKLREAGREDLIKIHEINQSGYAGIMPNGNIVDRIEFPEAIPVQKNSLFGIPEPKELPKDKIVKQDNFKWSFNVLISKFDNGIELYQNNAVFANCIEHLLRGGDVYKILEEIIVIQSSTQEKLTELIKSGTLKQEIIVSKEKFDEIIEKGIK